MALVHTEIVVAGETLQVFTLPDRRPAAASSQPVRWMYQIDLKAILYNNNGDYDTSRSTGAAYRLLQRTPGAAGRALCLRAEVVLAWGSSLTQSGICCESPSVRMLTLVPVSTAVNAANVFGETKASASLIKALGYDRPAEWDEDEGEEEGEEGKEQRDYDGDDGSSSSGKHGGDHSDGVASIAATEQFEYDEDDEGGGGVAV